MYQAHPAIVASATKMTPLTAITAGRNDLKIIVLLIK
jgi:hypothetical protein